MSPDKVKKLHFGFFYIIFAHIGFDQEAEAEAGVTQWTQGSDGFGKQVVLNLVSLPCKMS